MQVSHTILQDLFFFEKLSCKTYFCYGCVPWSSNLDICGCFFKDVFVDRSLT